MDWDWINSVHISDDFERGVEEFIQFVQCNANNSGHDGVKYRCLCVNWLNERRLDVKKIKKYLLCDGFLQSYTTWTWHGELLNLPSVPLSQEYAVPHGWCNTWLSTWWSIGGHDLWYWTWVFCRSAWIWKHVKRCRDSIVYWIN